MKYKDIARTIILSRGIHQEVIAEDGVRHNPSGRAFTEKQLTKIREHHEAAVAWLRKKWKLDEE